MTMKTNVMTLAALLLAGAAVSSCSSDSELISPETALAGQSYTMTIEASKGGETRALTDNTSQLTSTWTAGDVVEVWSSDETTKYGELTASAAGKSTTLSGTLDTAPSADETLLLKYLSQDYITQDGTLTGSATSIDKVCDYATATVTVSTVDAEAKTMETTAADFQNQQVIVKFTLTDNTSAAINATKLLVDAGGWTCNVTPATPTNVFYVAIPGFSGQRIILNATDGTNAYVYGKSDMTFDNGEYYRISVKMQPVEYVDLGIVVGGKSILFATVNVGAASESDYGTFFEWAGTTGYSSAGTPVDGQNFNWNNDCPYWVSGTLSSDVKLSKYVPTYQTDYWYGGGTPDGKTTLDEADDAAVANWGSDCRMPTNEELSALYDTKGAAGYSWEWTTVDEHQGYRITNTTTNKSIFLPAAGYRNESSLSEQGATGFYWSSTLTTGDARFANHLKLTSSSVTKSSHFRYHGRSVRAVKEVAVAPSEPTGNLNGKFAISASKQVYFSKGNLQATTTDLGSTWTWAFAENQWDYIGGRSESGSEPQTGNNFINGNGTVSDNGTIDLFCWVGSSSSFTGIAQYGITYSTSFEDYGAANETWKSDWGTLPITNGGNVANSGWRTLTSAEWTYLFYTRTASTVNSTSNARYAKATVNGKQGIILFPDSYTHPEGVTAPKNINTKTSGWSGNQYSDTNWTKMETAGAVFLPAAGYRKGATVYDPEDPYCIYWSSTSSSDAGFACTLYSTTENLIANNPHFRSRGYSVRLVWEVK